MGRARLLLAAGLSLLVMTSIPGAMAEPTASGGPLPDATPYTSAGGDGSDAAGACAPPCGWIQPVIQFDFPDVVRCGGFGLDATAEQEACTPLMDVGESFTYDGRVIWQWEITDEGFYTNDPSTDIELTLQRSGGSASFLDLTAEPSTFVITTADLLDPDRLRTDTSDPTKVRIWYWFEESVSVTITRTGDPTPDEQARIDHHGGSVWAYLKGSSNGSGERYKEAFGLKQFEFTMVDASSSDGEDAPFAPWLVAAALAAAVAIRRR